ncbi:MAG: alpha-galactosidase [Terriglobia bacterium]
MRAFISVMTSILISTSGLVAQNVAPISVTNAGWTITADPERQSLIIAHDRLGTIIQDVQLGLRGEQIAKAPKNWSIVKEGQSALLVRTGQHRPTWVFNLDANALKISATSAEAVLTGRAAAPKDRVVARVLDPEGFPVDWVGTNEVAHGYQGSETRNPSFLPRNNPETMFFSLGQVSGAHLHGLFDRKTDTVIHFSEQTRLERSAQDPNLLNVAMPVPGNAVIRLIPDYYTKTLRVPFYAPFDDSYFAAAPMVWGSWTSTYHEVREEDIVRNTDWIAANLKPYGFQYVQLDDGYDRGKKGEHYWIENWDSKKFPHGPKWLTDYIKSKGLRAGLWLVPNAYAGATEKHPDWYLRDKQGKFILDYHTPSLDSTNPQVLEFLRKEFRTLGDWGFEYYKFDGEHALPQYIPAVDHTKLFDKTVDPIVAYRNRLKVIREAVGPKTFIEGCPAGTPLNGIGYFNSYFTGHDVYNSWQGMYALFSSINANAFLNHMVIYVMPGEGIEVGPPMTVEEAKQKRPPSVVATARTREEPMMGFGTTLPEARTLVTYLALTGVVYPLASVLPELPEERVRLLKMTLPTLPILPVDLFSRGTDMQWDKFKHTTPDDYIHNYPEVLDLKVNASSGVYDVVGLTNWRSGAATMSVSFAHHLGLQADSPYVAFDFWGQRILGVFEGQMEVPVQSHDTRVLLLHPVSNRPQLVGNSRHISGAYSILDVAWDGSKKTLRGTAQPVPGDEYTLWVYVAKGWSLDHIRVATKGGSEVPAQHELSGNSLKISFPGQQDLVDWQIVFTGGDASK